MRTALLTLLTFIILASACAAQVINVVVDDSTVVVDGEGRKVSLPSVPSDWRAIHGKNGSWYVELKSGGNKAITPQAAAPFAQAWQSAAPTPGTVQPPTAAEVQRATLEQILTLHTRVMALERERDRNPDSATTVQPMIDEAESQITALRGGGGK